jgi:hypothetical protein
MTMVGVLATLATAGCKEDAIDSNGGISLEAAPAEIAKAVCPKAYSCCVASQLMGNDLAGTDEASCEAKTTTGFRNQLNGVKSSVSKKRSRYRGDKMQACVDFIRSATCDQLRRTNHFSGLECDPYVEPLVAPGDKCGNDYECVGGFCAKEDKAAEGICKTFPILAESCATVRCGKGLVCDENKICRNGLVEGATCSSNLQCLSGNCTAPVSTDKSCAPPPADKCFYSSACAYGRSGRVPLVFLVLAIAAIIMKSRKRPAGSARPPI